jgi:cytochrome c oxidase assembly factor CtaG
LRWVAPQALSVHDGAVSLTSWTFDPAILLSLALVGGLYARGWRYLRRRRRSVAAGQAAGAEKWRAACFVGGLATLLIALESPIGTYDQDLFVLHMTQHLLLTALAPPLLLLGAPLLPILWGLPADERRGAGRLLSPRGVLRWLGNGFTHPYVALPVFLVTFSVWHIPVLYDAAEGQTLIHYTEHVLFFATALLFWWPVIHPNGGARRLSRVGGILYFTPGMFVTTLIGALLTFASNPLYSTYANAPRLTSLSAVDDQQLAGLVMWIPGGMVYIAAVLWLLARALQDEEDAERRLSTLPN